MKIKEKLILDVWKFTAKSTRSDIEFVTMNIHHQRLYTSIFILSSWVRILALGTSLSQFAYHIVM